MTLTAQVETSRLRSNPDNFQVLLAQLQFRPWRAGHWGQGDGGGVWPAGHTPEDNAAQL